MAASKPYTGTLSTGQHYLICTTTWDSGNRRYPLTIAVTRPGETVFSRVFVIRHARFEAGPGESHDRAALAYPYAVEHEGKLYVAYSNSGGGVGRTGKGRELWNNNSAELAIIPIESLSLDPVPPKKPNILLILADDLGYGDLGCYGSRTVRTPRIDWMAEAGVKFSSFYAAAPICTPTRAALMTGRYANRAGLPTPLHVYDEKGLADSEVTLAEVLQKAGYRTACVGKWHLGHLSRYYPTRHGFEVYYGTPLGHMFNRPAVGKAVGDTSDLFLDGEKTIPFPPDEELTERLTEAAVSFIRENRDGPFFLFMSHTMPHEPLAVSKRFAGKSKGGLYGDVVECIDWSTGQILDALREEKILSNTVVVFTSDNGPKKGHGSADPLRGFKHQPYEGGVRVPCVAWIPLRYRGAVGGTIDGIRTVMDIFPTFAWFAGAELPDGLESDGKLIPGLLGCHDLGHEHSHFFYFVRHGVLAGVRDERWKLLLQKGGVPELYDLENDLGESHNLAAEHPRIVRRLTLRMEDLQEELEESEGER